MEKTQVLAFAFFAAVFSTLTWLIYIFRYFSDKIGAVSFSQLGLLDLAIYIAVALLPILILWMIFGYINQYLNFTHISQNSKILYQQLKKNLDYTDLIARILLEAEQEVKNSFILNKFELFISDMNELLAETLQRGALAAPEQIDRLWLKVKNGGKWAFGKVIIEVSTNQPNFGSRLVAKAQSDTVLGGTILEFCARYQNLLNILEKHDKEKVFLSIIETGVYGKVYSILAPLGEQIRRARIDLTQESSIKVASRPEFEPLKEKQEIFAHTPREERKLTSEEEAKLDDVDIKAPEIQKNYASFMSETPKKKFMNIFNSIKTHNFFDKKSLKEDDFEPELEEKDPFSMALERSFGATTLNENDGREEPMFGETAEDDSNSKADIKFYHLNEAKDDDGMPELNISTREEDDYGKNNITGASETFLGTKSSRFDNEDGIGFTSTQKALNSLKKEWQEMKAASEPTLSRPAPDFLRREPVMSEQNKLKESPLTDDDFAYPFGGWRDAENYDNK